MMIQNITIIGGGGQCHAIAPWLAKHGYDVSILTNRPEKWSSDFGYTMPDGSTGTVHLANISANPADVIPQTDVVLVTVPGFVIGKELESIRPYLRKETFVGGVFASNGFFFEALKVFGDSQPLFGFQRVPFIARAAEYGRVGNILGTKSSLVVAVENASTEQTHEFVNWLEEAFEIPVNLRKHYLEVAISNSNPLLHTSRLYAMLADRGDKPFSSNFGFYSSWDDKASELYIAMDRELHELINVLPIDHDCLPTVLEYYEQPDAQALTRKISTIPAFQGILSPLIETPDGFVADYSSRYFSEDFENGLRNYVELARKYGISCPEMTKVYNWGHGKLIQALK